MKITQQVNQQLQIQSLKEARYKIQTIKQQATKRILTGAISNNLKYIIAGGSDNLLKIWNYITYDLIKSIQFNDSVISCKFTDDSKLLYVGIGSCLYQFYVKNEFKKLSKQDIHGDDIDNIYCITNTIILSQSYKTIIKTDFKNKHQLLRIESHDYDIYGLDFNKSLNLIASGSNCASIKLWNGNNGSLIMEQQNAQNNNTGIFQVLFINNNNQLISLDSYSKLILWNINYQKKQFQHLQSIVDSGFNISLVFQQQYIITTGKRFIKVYTIKGDFVREFDHDVKIFNLFFNITQLDSMKAVLILGGFQLQVCKFQMDLIEEELK